jgi:hypothetical protein
MCECLEFPHLGRLPIGGDLCVGGIRWFRSLSCQRSSGRETHFCAIISFWGFRIERWKMRYTWRMLESGLGFPVVNVSI